MATVPQFPTGTLSRSSLNTMVTELTTNIDNSNIAAGAGIAISKTALGTFTAWTAWTPTAYIADNVTAVTVNLNNAADARYMQIGKLVICQFYWTLAANTAFNIYIVPPVTPFTTNKSNATAPLLGTAEYKNASPGKAIYLSLHQSSARINAIISDGSQFSTTAWGGTFMYEAA